MGDLFAPLRSRPPASPPAGVVRWEDPPAAHSAAGKPKHPRRTDKWRTVATELRRRPGEWAVLLEAERFGNGGGIAGQIKAGALIAFRPAGAFDATTRTVDGLYTVYARYVGDPGATGGTDG